MIQPLFLMVHIDKKVNLVYNFNEKINLLNEKENDYGKPKEKFAGVL